MDQAVSLTLYEFFVLLKRYGAGFQSLGVKPGDHVCVVLNNSLTHYVAMIGCIFAGATIVLAKPSLTERELIYHANDGDAVYLLTESQLSGKVLAASSKMQLKGLFVIGEAAGFVSIDGFPLLEEKDFKPVPVADPSNTVAALVYSSGSTGLPKGVEFTHQSFVASVHVNRVCLAPGDVDVRLGWNPISQGSGLILVLVAVLAGDSCVITSSTPTFQELVDVVETFKITFIYSFPTQLRGIVEKMLESGTKLPSVRRIAVGGGELTESLARSTLLAFRNLKELMNTFGMTESCGMVSTTAGCCIAKQDVGFPSPHVEIKIVDTHSGMKLAANKHGEICFKAATAARGYYKRPDATADLIDSEGWLHSGDVGYYDEDGRLFYVNRIKDMFKYKDKNIAPVELEAILLTEIEGIQDVAIVGLPDPRYGAAPAAFVVVKETHRDLVTEEQIKEVITRTCSEHKHLHGGVYFVDNLPKTENGKIQRQKILQDLKL